jgi:hypothetical protein
MAKRNPTKSSARSPAAADAPTETVSAAPAETANTADAATTPEAHNANAEAAPSVDAPAIAESAVDPIPPAPSTGPMVPPLGVTDEPAAPALQLQTEAMASSASARAAMRQLMEDLATNVAPPAPGAFCPRIFEVRLNSQQAALQKRIHAALTARGVPLPRNGSVYPWLLDQLAAMLADLD